MRLFTQAPMPTSEALYTISPTNDSTLVIEILKTGLLRRRKHHIFFEKFVGNLCYSAERPEASKVSLTIESASAVCRDQWLNKRKQASVTRYVRDRALQSSAHPTIQFVSRRIELKPLRGFVVEGELKILGVSRVIKVNVVLTPGRQESLQVDGDTIIKLSDFGIQRPSSFFVLAGTQDDALIRALVWAVPQARDRPRD
ncbi:MAG: YceI family protein, partial [Acidobacteriaceae bacterium]|nr:YceI family protein [Acidobacteriaceae bacterium]